MLFHVRMDVRLPHDMPEERAAELKRVEKARAAELQQAGTWRHRRCRCSHSCRSK